MINVAVVGTGNISPSHMRGYLARIFHRVAEVGRAVVVGAA